MHCVRTLESYSA